MSDRLTILARRLMSAINIDDTPEVDADEAKIIAVLRTVRNEALESSALMIEKQAPGSRWPELIRALSHLPGHQTHE